MELYTYIMEFRGGTYVTQVKANSIDCSVPKWLEQIEREVAESRDQTPFKSLKAF